MQQDQRSRVVAPRRCSIVARMCTGSGALVAAGIVAVMSSPQTAQAQYPEQEEGLEAEPMQQEQIPEGEPIPEEEWQDEERQFHEQERTLEQEREMQRRRDQEQAQREAFEDWGIKFQPYGMLPLDVDGSASVRPQTRSMGLDPGDLDDGQFLAGLRLEGWTGRFGLIFDGSYLQLEQNPAAFELKARQAAVDSMLGLRLFETPTVNPGDPSLGVELNGGFRALWIRNEFQTGEFRPEDDEWMAQFVGQVHVPITLSEFFGIRGTAAITAPDDVSWWTEAMAEFRLQPVVLGIGYRYDDLDQQGDDVGLNVESHSIMGSLGFRIGPGWR